MEKILIVDDTASNRFLLKTILTSAGFTVSECADGAEAVRLCSLEKPSLVILDIMMPVMDGIECCRRLRESYSAIDLPVVVITSREEGEVLPEALRVGANDYIAKPINREVLLARVRNQLDIAAARRDAMRLLEIQSTMMEALPQALAIVDSEGSIVDSNQPWQEACGGQPERTIAACLQQLFNGAFVDPLYQILIDSISDPELCIERELEASQGATCFVQLVSKPIEIHGGENLRLWLFRDITRTRELERRINERIRLESVSMLVRGVAHNFNNILGGISGAAELLERYLPDEERPKRAMKLIRKGAQAAAKLTKKLSLFSGINRPEDDLYVDNLDEVLGAIAMMVQEQVGERITIQCAPTPELPKLRIGVAHFIEVTNHLLSNAVDAIAAAGKIEIRTELDPSGKSISITICDNGVGMSPETVGRVFEPFFTTKNLDERNAIGIDGHGLGLWNVYNLLRACDGDIRVESALGRGTTVTIQIPTVPEGKELKHELAS